MPYNSNEDISQMIYLKDYALFVENNKIDDMVPVYIMNIYTFNIPILKYFKHYDEGHILILARQGIIKLLKGIISGDAINEVKKNLEAFKTEGVSTIPRAALSIKDITLIYSAQKISFQSFLPYYTKDVAVASQIMIEIEIYYKQVQEMALEMLENIKYEEEEKRMELEDKYQDLFENASDLIQIVSPEGYILYVNNAWSTTLGYSGNFKGKLIYDYIKKSEVENFKKYREKIIEGKTLQESIRTCFIKDNGEEVIVEGYINCKYKNGVPLYTRALLRDITLRLKQEKQLNFYVEQLAEREENLQNIIKNAPDGVIVINAENNIVLWNPKAEEIFGWQKEEALGKNMSDLIVPENLREAHRQGMKRFLTTRKPHILNLTVEVPAIHKSGNEFYISLTVSHSVQGGRDNFIAFLRDITDQKKNEIELGNKRKQLEKSNQELEQYAWLTSHDLKEPLRKILTFSDALLTKHYQNLPEQTYNYIEKIVSSASRMSRLIEAVLQYSNVNSDAELFIKTNLNDIIKEVVEDLEIMITSKKAEVIVGDLPIVHAIPIQMKQLFQNLISNAIKYSKENEKPLVQINCEKFSEGFNISIKDNGIGFDPIYAEKIFEVFQRLIKNRTYEGTGIGLALCKKIAETHYGNIHAESIVGVGSTFVIYLPAQYVNPKSQAT